MMVQPKQQSGQRIPTLDGWRGIAILMVLMSHFLPGYLDHPVMEKWLNLGQHGVQIFFVLSGYLITSNLLREDKIHLGRFYVRRLFRLMPAAWTYLLFLGLLSAFTHLKALGNDIWSCLFFFRNYVPETTANTCTEHFWSLSLEEQFYLAWPPVLVLLGQRRSAWAAGIATLGLSMYKVYAWSRPHTFFIFQHTEFRADGLLVGCLLAILLQRESARSWVTRHGRTAFWICLPLLGLTLYRYQGDGFMSLHESLLLAILIACTSLCPDLLPGRVLEMQFLKTTGVLSYSIYLWQGLFLRSTWGIFGPFCLGAAFLLCWRFIEQPGIRFGRKLIAKKVSAEDPAIALAS
ncbi:MAG TPA: acyltransferase [Terracidiphilus sp.]|jgi:peptidoglycan/LPS O-acetylase OafA/YrhL|nr:acyltransferase [Terracidiphilus sp.]